MKLHEDKDAFISIIDEVSSHTSIRGKYIEKDYFVSLLLHEIVKEFPNIVFKGGTSLSKCYKLIKRFSEDIDITVSADINMNSSLRRKLKKSIIEAVDTVQMELVNGEDIKSRRDFNEYQVKYPLIIGDEMDKDLKENIIVESYVPLKPFPCERKVVSNYILDFLRDNEEHKIIGRYNLHDFEINVQRIDRTLVDKLFALCDYYEAGTFNQYSRHIYDIHMIWLNNDFERTELRDLFNNVAIERSKGKRNLAATDGYMIKATLLEIIGREIFKSDYKYNTEQLLFEFVPYEEVIATLKELIESGFIPDRVRIPVFLQN